MRRLVLLLLFCLPLTAIRAQVLLDDSLPQSVLVNPGVIALNQVIAAAVHASGDGFVYVDVVEAFEDHGIGSVDPWIVAPPAADAFHPNPSGHAAYADAIRGAL